MLGINLKHTLAIGTVAAVVLATAGSASAGTHQSGVLYNGHAGLGASAHQPNQTDLEFLAFAPKGPRAEGRWLASHPTHAAGVTDGTSNTIMFAKRAASPRRFSIDRGEGTAVIEPIGTKYTMSLKLRVDATTNEVAVEALETPAVISGDAYDNEMGVRATRLLPDIDDEVL